LKKKNKKSEHMLARSTLAAYILGVFKKIMVIIC